jgi:hypothetical protein
MVSSRERDGNVVEVVTRRADLLAELRDTGRFDLYRTEDLPHGLGVVIVGDHYYTYVKLYDDDHRLTGTIVDEGLEAYRWAERVYRSDREDAEPVAPF